MITEKEFGELIYIYRKYEDIRKIKQELKEKGILKLNAKEKLEECYNNIYKKDIIVEDFVRDLYKLALEAIKEAEERNE